MNIPMGNKQRNLSLFLWLGKGTAYINRKKINKQYQQILNDDIKIKKGYTNTLFLTIHHGKNQGDPTNIWKDVNKSCNKLNRNLMRISKKIENKIGFKVKQYIRCLESTS